MTFGYVADSDRSDDVTVCTRVDDIASLAKLSYYAIKLLKALSTP